MTSYGPVERTLLIPGDGPKKPVVVGWIFICSAEGGGTAAPARVFFGPRAMAFSQEISVMWHR